MPDCGCYHSFSLNYDASGMCRIECNFRGYTDFRRVLESTRVATCITQPKPPSLFHSQNVFHLFGVSDRRKLESLCEAMKSKIIVDLRPNVDFCFALGPYSLFSENSESSRSEIGSLVYEGKYRRNRSAVNSLGQQLLRFIQAHPILNSATAISSPPESQSDLPNLAGVWANLIANYLGQDMIAATKNRSTAPQKNLEDDISEKDAIGQLTNSISVSGVRSGSKVLILDDTMRSGGTLIEMARALRQAGAVSVYGLSAAKDAKFTRGISLRRDHWE